MGRHLGQLQGGRGRGLSFFGKHRSKEITLPAMAGSRPDAFLSSCMKDDSESSEPNRVTPRQVLIGQGLASRSVHLGLPDLNILATLIYITYSQQRWGPRLRARESERARPCRRPPSAFMKEGGRCSEPRTSRFVDGSLSRYPARIQHCKSFYEHQGSGSCHARG